LSQKSSECWAQFYFQRNRTKISKYTSTSSISASILFLGRQQAGTPTRSDLRGLVIDPYNEIEHRRPREMSETEYVSQSLGKVKRFAQSHGVAVWFIAHPLKMHRDSNGKVPIPTLYDISGSANWSNKADVGITVSRPSFAHGNTDVEIHIRKVRHKAVGRVGQVTLRYDRAIGTYSDVPTSPALNPRKRRASSLV